MTVWVVKVDDGNVCCPAYEIDSLWSTLDQAEKRALMLESARVDEMEVDPDPGSLPGGSAVPMRERTGPAVTLSDFDKAVRNAYPATLVTDLARSRR